MSLTDDVTCPEGLTFRCAYGDDPRARAAFKEFLIAVHGLDLTLWEEGGFWDELYTPFSLFEGERIVSSLSLYSMDMMIQGKRCRVGQFSGVGTLPSYRRIGLGRWLTEQAMTWAAPTHSGFFLFSSEEALPFYERCGFVPVQESVPVLKIDSPRPKSGFQRLDAGNTRDLETIYRLACERTPVSDVLGVWNPKLTMFHALYTLQDCAYHIPDLDVIVFCRMESGLLTLFDVVGRRMPTLSELHPYLAETPHQEVHFRFEPDRLVVAISERRELEENNLHIDPAFRVPGHNCIFPYTAQA